jgi:hypothetical protein
VRKRSAAIFFAVLLSACVENAQVARRLGSIRTSSTSPVVADLSFVDSGRWTIFALSRSSTASAWPFPFHAQILSADGKVLIEREVTEVPEFSHPNGREGVTWRVDTLSEPFESNFDDEGLMPIDHALKDGERYTLRLHFSPAVDAEYQVHVLEDRAVYPWETGT